MNSTSSCVGNSLVLAKQLNKIQPLFQISPMLDGLADAANSKAFAIGMNDYSKLNFRG